MLSSHIVGSGFDTKKASHDPIKQNVKIPTSESPRYSRSLSMPEVASGDHFVKTPVEKLEQWLKEEKKAAKNGFHISTYGKPFSSRLAPAVDLKPPIPKPDEKRFHFPILSRPFSSHSSLYLCKSTRKPDRPTTQRTSDKPLFSSTKKSESGFFSNLIRKLRGR